MKGLQLIRVGFDSLENHNPEYEEVVATFLDDAELTSHKKCGDFLKQIKIHLLIHPHTSAC